MAKLELDLMLKFELQVECIKTTTKKKLDKISENIPCWWSYPFLWSPQPSSFPCLLLFPTQSSAQWKLHSWRLHMTMNYTHQDYIYTPKP